MSFKLVAGMVAGAVLGVASLAAAQAPGAASDHPWSVSVGIGVDNSISGNINSSAIGTIGTQAVVITKNTYESVYGTGLHLRFGGGYMVDDWTEVTGSFTFQSLDADLTPMGDIGVSHLYGQYTDYQTLSFDVGLRRYLEMSPRARLYAEGTIGLGFVDKTDVTLVAPSINFGGKATDFYDQTAALAFGGNVGVMFQTGPKVDVFGQLGLRWMSGMAEIDDLEGTSLDTINDKSSRTTLPFVVGVRMRF